MAKNKITIVFLLRNSGEAELNLQEFISSLELFTPGANHDLLYIFKNFKPHEIEILVERYEINKSNFIELPDTNFDIGSYYFSVRHIRTEYVIFLNTFSRPLYKNWLKLYLNAMETHDSGLIGATGSYESFGFNPPIKDGHSLVVSTKRIIKFFYRIFLSIINLQFRTRFPNPHIRTNAFLTKVSTFKNYIDEIGLPNSKLDCHKIESGPDSYTNYAVKKNLNPGVISSNGAFFTILNMHKSNVFRRGEQSDLIISDNRTNDYKESKNARKRSLEWDSWRINS